MSNWKTARRSGPPSASNSPAGKRAGHRGAIDDIEGEPPAPPKSASYQEQLERSEQALNEILERAVSKMLTEVLDANGAAGDDERRLEASVMNGSVVGVFDWVQLQAKEVLAGLSSANQNTGRQSVTELKVRGLAHINQERTLALSLRAKALPVA